VRAFRVVPVLVLYLLAGCGSLHQSHPVDPLLRTYVEVDNRGFADMTIYVVDGSQRIRLGIAPGNARTEFPIPWHLVASARQLQFLADPIGSSRQAFSDQIYVEPGDHVVLLIP